MGLRLFYQTPIAGEKQNSSAGVGGIGAPIYCHVVYGRRKDGLRQFPNFAKMIDPANYTESKKPSQNEPESKDYAYKAAPGPLLTSHQLLPARQLQPFSPRDILSQPSETPSALWALGLTPCGPILPALGRS